MNGESAYDRHLRIVAISTGFGSIVFSLLALADIIKDFSVLEPVFAWVGTILFCGLPIVFIPLGRWGTIPALKALAGAHTVVSVLVVVAWAPLQVAAIPDATAPWILNTLAVPSASAVIAFRGRVVWVYLVAITVAGSALRWIGLGRKDLVIPLEDGLSMLEVSAVIATLLLVALAAGRAQDDALARAVTDARGAAEAESRARQRTRFGAFVHDDVITTLLVASQAAARVPGIRRSAERAIERLDDFLAARTDDIPLDADLFEVEVRAAVTEIVNGVEFAGSFRESSGAFPAAVALAVTDAVREAARNSVRHGGAEPIARRLTMGVQTNTIRVEFTDHGAGFDPARVAESRFGIRTSIVERLASVGGTAVVLSAPGRGTTVVLEWQAAR